MISKALARKLRQYIEKAALSLTDEDALDAVELYPIWQINTAYAVSDRIRSCAVIVGVFSKELADSGNIRTVTP